MSGGSYVSLAKSYDIWMHDVDYESWWSYLESAFELTTPSAVLEVGCGTGNLTSVMLKRGFSVTASDSSEAMLAQAERKLRGMGKLRLLQLDMRRLPTELGSFDLVVASCDVVNYLCSRQDVEKFFRSALSLLSPRGYLLFDIHGPARIAEWRVRPCINQIEEHACYLWRVDLRGSHIWHTLTGFTRSGENSWERFDEAHHQRYYTALEMTESLRNAGFSHISCHEFGTDEAPSNESIRVQFGARA